MKQPWNQRIARAQELSQEHPSASEILVFYTHLATFQKSLYDDLQRTRPEASIETILPHLEGLLKVVTEHGPVSLSQAARTLAGDPSRWREILVSSESDCDPVDVFIARALLQPYTEYLASRADILLNATRGECPFCGEKPVVAVLRGEGDGGKRSLVCSLCSTEWEFRRLLCPSCREENKDHLPVYTTPAFDYVRVEACESCHVYIKAIDLTKNGRAVPVVDELASVALDLWADEQGYTKLARNVLGL